MWKFDPCDEILNDFKCMLSHHGWAFGGGTTMHMRFIKSIAALILAASATPLRATPAGFGCAEGFEDVATLAARGWILRDNSLLPGVFGWAQGDPQVFPASTPPWDSYAMAGVGADVTSPGIISNWLITPEIDFGPNPWSVRSFGFLTRAAGGRADRLEVRLCMKDANTSCSAPGPRPLDFGGFQQISLMSINSSQLSGIYPDAWTDYPTGADLNLPVVGRGRIAFHYFMFVQPGTSTASAVGIDSAVMAGATACPFTEIVFISGFE